MYSSSEVNVDTREFTAKGEGMWYIGLNY